MPSIRQIAANTASVSFQAGGEEIIVEYFPAKLTEKTISELGRLDHMTDEKSVKTGFKALNETLCYLVKSWNLFEDDEETVMFPLEPARLAELPIFLRKAVLDAIMGDIRPETLAPQAKRELIPSS